MRGDEPLNFSLQDTGVHRFITHPIKEDLTSLAREFNIPIPDTGQPDTGHPYRGVSCLSG